MVRRFFDFLNLSLKGIVRVIHDRDHFYNFSDYSFKIYKPLELMTLEAFVIVLLKIEFQKVSKYEDFLTK